MNWCYRLTCALLCLLLLSCGGGHHGAPDEKEIPMEYASFLRMYEGEGYTRVTITNPWDTTQLLHSYLLVPDSLPLPEVSSDATVIRTPIRRSVVFSSVHSSLLDELGSLESVAGVCDAGYLNNEALKKRLREGKVTDCGSSMSADMERIVSVNPDVLMLSPYQDPAPYAKLKELGVPVVECADYMETAPLARAEWIKFYAALAGKQKEGEQMFAATRDEYNRLKNLAGGVKTRPEILTELKQGESWLLPARRSTTGIFIEDAGGRLPEICEGGEGGSVAYSPEKVLMAAGDADIWMVRYYRARPMTYEDIETQGAIYRNFDAFRGRRIYGCNTAQKQYYEEVPFHPHWLLADMISFFHPELGVTPYPGKSYYTPISADAK